MTSFSDSDHRDRDFEQALETVERSLQDLRERYEAIVITQDQIEDLKNQYQEVSERQANNGDREPLKTELHLIEQEIENLELKLESRLFTWQEPFWQIVRFTGGGIVLGWLLKSCAA